MKPAPPPHASFRPRTALAALLLAAVSGPALVQADDPAPGPALVALAARWLDGRQAASRIVASHDEWTTAGWRLRDHVELAENRNGDFRADVSAAGRSAVVRRDANITEIIVPAKNILFRGFGAVEDANRFSPREALASALNADPKARAVAAVAAVAPAQGWAALEALLGKPDTATTQTRDAAVVYRPQGRATTDTLTVAVQPGGRVEVLWGRGHSHRATLAIEIHDKPLPLTEPDTATLRVEDVDRNTMERMLGRGLARAATVQMERLADAVPPDSVTSAPGGRLEVRDGRRLLLLSGTPRQAGIAHGRLLAPEVGRVIDSTLHFVGLGYTIESGKWFPMEMRQAWAGLEPHIPKDVIEEIGGIAQGSGLPFEEVKMANFFPELFHCSGFAVAGSATEGGKLYHGRVLDYMTDAGLQFCACVTVTSEPARLAWANVGYAGFVGSVSGMNAKGISIGEMGGRGEGKWDGVPMSILVRNALETAQDLDAAKAVFADSPRTCEYYYVIADGRARKAVGVYATPEDITFLAMGERHERLPRPLADCVLLSAGKRYDTLVDRVQAGFGRIGEREALRLMDKGVAMGGANLHNVLFVPGDLTFFVANASGRDIAANRPYARYDLSAILAAMPAAPAE